MEDETSLEIKLNKIIETVELLSLAVLDLNSNRRVDPITKKKLEKIKRWR